jgi:succinate dehydrogenase / fumarate reductase cytochrome b subunit
MAATSTTSQAPFWRSTLGRKVVMAVTGVILFGFVVGHMAGNLQVYLGPEAMNAYAVFLRTMLHGAGLWIARSVLLVSVVLHIWAAVTLSLESRSARPQGYRQEAHRASTYASRTMVWSGPLLFLFIAYHLAHLTFGSVHPEFVEGDVYHNFVSGFSSWPVSLLYIAAMLVLGLHLFHGSWSMLQTLGLSHPRWNPLRLFLAAGLSLLVVVGNLSFPVAVLAGFLRDDRELMEPLDNALSAPAPPPAASEALH